ncbi:hypothetical protein HZP94_08315 [Elizabethkingia anophelis]|nr:hypothetical protein [Elizabethkingia anophelis]MCT4062935.1 hypothetical protein [Elizabethkingia anophelis]MCT4109227.1 hypothetical protein [Elizabethkingia anophelis]
MNKPVTEANIVSDFTSPDRQKIGFDYRGEACGIGSGNIILTKIDDSHFKWNYRSVGGIMDLSQCPEYSENIKSYIYMTGDLTFTKQ